MQLIYLIVGAVCLWVVFCCGRVWLLLQLANQHRKLTHFAQHQVVLISLSSMFCVGLCAVTAYSMADEYGVLSRWWAMFDVFVCIIMLGQIKYLEQTLLAGRQG